MCNKLVKNSMDCWVCFTKSASESVCTRELCECRLVGGTGARAGQPEYWQRERVRDDRALARRPSAGVAQEGTAARHLLPRLALARPSDAPRTPLDPAVQVPVQRAREGSLHQSVCSALPSPVPPFSRHSTRLSTHSLPPFLHYYILHSI